MKLQREQYGLYLFVIIICIIGITLLHELTHATACKAIGGNPVIRPSLGKLSTDCPELQTTLSPTNTQLFLYRFAPYLLFGILTIFFYSLNKPHMISIILVAVLTFDQFWNIIASLWFMSDLKLVAMQSIPLFIIAMTFSTACIVIGTKYVYKNIR